jgi:Protein of unknown function (DUF3224)
MTVVPDSGTGQLVGLAGTMKITIPNGKQSYAFEIHACERCPTPDVERRGARLPTPKLSPRSGSIGGR